MIYRDVFDRPSAEVTISVFGIMAEPYYALHSTNNYPSRKWNINTPITSIIAEMESDGFICTEKKDGHGDPIIKCIHAETQSIIESERREQAIKFMDAEKGFIRFGELPRDGKSKNHRDNTLEVGVSCFYAEFAKDGTYRLLLTPVQEVSYISVSGRIPYRLYGELVGTGADGEPLLCVERYEKLE